MKLNTAEAIVLFLKEKGIDTAFGIIGGAIEPITDAVNKYKLNEYYPAHESTCAYAAAKYYEYSNKPALVFSTTGAGILNLVNGVGSSFAEKKPMFIVVPQEKICSHYKGALQSSREGGINTINILKEITCFCEEITSSKHLEQKINIAWNKMITKQQPVALSIPMDILKEISKKPKLFKSINKSSIELENYNENDCIIIGENCSSLLFNIVAFSEKNNIPIIDIPASRGFIPNGLKNYKGMVGMAGHSQAVKILNESKNILFLYGDIQETNIGDNEEWLDKTIFITNSIEDSYKARDQKFIIEKSGFNNYLKKYLNKNYTEFENYNFINETLIYEKEDTVNTKLLYEYLSNELPVDTHAFFDCGNSFLFGLHNWKVKKSKFNNNKTVNIVMNQASMASSIPLLIGAVVAKPNNNYLCITGDGSFKMGSNELNLLKQFKSNIILCILNDSVMGMAMHGQRIGGAQVTGIDNGFTDFSLIGKASGIQSFVVNKMEDLELIPLNLKETILIDIRIDKEIIPPILERMKTLK